MNKKEFYHFYYGGKKWDLFNEGEFIFFKWRKNWTNKDEKISYVFAFYLKEIGKVVGLKLKFGLEYYSYETRENIGRIEYEEIEDYAYYPFGIFARVRDISDYYFPCEKEIIDKQELIKIMEDDLNSHYQSRNDYKFYINYEELYNL